MCSGIMGDTFRLQVPPQKRPQRETIKEIFAANGYTYKKKFNPENAFG